MILDRFRLDGKTAIVTGARRGLGLGIAKGLAEAGADVFGVGTGDLAPCKEAVESAGRSFGGMRADLISQEPIDKIVSACVERFGKVDILVNNAGITRRDDPENLSEEDWDDVINLDLKSAFFLCQRVAREMIPRGGGKIVNICSMLSYQGGIRCASYAAAKSGLIGLTRNLANDWAKYNINVNGIAPGYMDTDMIELLKNDPLRSKELMGRIPAGRWGKPEDIAGAAVYLCGAVADYVHGFCIAVDGGWLSR